MADRAAALVRGDFDAEGFGQLRNLAQLRDAAGAHYVGLHDGRAPMFKQLPELCAEQQTFSGSDGYGRLGCDLAQQRRVFAQRRLFQIQGFQRGQGAGEFEGGAVVEGLRDARFVIPGERDGPFDGAPPAAEGLGGPGAEGGGGAFFEGGGTVGEVERQGIVHRAAEQARNGHAEAPARMA